MINALFVMRMNAQRLMVAVPCGHRIFEICSRKSGVGKKCCICMQPLEKYIKIF